MNILLVGSGGREHAIATQLAKSENVTLFIAPGNAGMEILGKCLPVPSDSIEELCTLAVQNKVDLVVVGPEVPLCLGLADKLKALNIPCFGPTRAAAKIEGSKSFSKDLMVQLGIPTATYSKFSSFNQAASWIKAQNSVNYVIKKSGLAAGKGVFLPKTTQEAIGIAYELLCDDETTSETCEIVIEERLTGEELSVLAFCDGKNYCVMPSSQDHKRLLDGDQGENTGGMGSYAPVPGYPMKEVKHLAKTFIEPILQHFEKQGTPYIGGLYAGLMLTPTGPKVLEYNCRFGDPETESLMALFTGDLAQTMLDCANGVLTDKTVSFSTKTACSIIIADKAYPTGPYTKTALTESDLLSTAETSVLHCGTVKEAGTVYSKGGRVLSVTATAENLEKAITLAYAKVKAIHFPNSQYRTDIGQKGLKLSEKLGQPSKSSAYDASGVDIDAGNRAVKLMGSAVKSTYTEAVLSQLGSFGGLFSCAELLTMKDPVLVASTDGVGTKVKLAASVKSYASVGRDIVNHCVDDILVQGAKPLFFLDYFATSKLDPEMVAEIVGGMAEACRANGCALIGGETAEMPGVYEKGEFDIAGTIVGVVERDKLLPKTNIQVGDVLVGFTSDSPHTNGYSLIRKTFENVDLCTIYPELGVSLEKALLTSHKSYLPIVYPVLQKHPGLIKGLSHITGGGFYENIPRILPQGVDVRIDKTSWQVPPLYRLIEKMSGTSESEMYRVFNQGIGLVAVVSKENVSTLQANVGEKTFVIGEVVKGKGEKPTVTVE